MTKLIACYVALAAIIGIVAGEMLLRLYFPEPLPAINDCCEEWAPCPGRPIETVAGRSYQWYCGSSRAKYAEVPDAGSAIDRAVELDAGAE